MDNSNNQDQERVFTGIWIPKEVLFDKSFGLKYIDKGVLMEISCLQKNKQRGCYATNRHFSKMFDVSPERCSQIIKKLKELDFITVNFQYQDKQITERNIFMTEKGSLFVKGAIKYTLAPLKQAKGPLKKTRELDNNLDNIGEIISKEIIIADSEEKETESAKTEFKISSFSENPPASLEKIKVTYAADPATDTILECWNNLPCKIHRHKQGTKTYQKISERVNALLNGFYARKYIINQEYKQKNDIDNVITDKKWTIQEIIRIVELYPKLHDSEYNPYNRDTLPKNLYEFLYNDQMGTSVFFSLAAKGGPKLYCQKSLDQKIVNLYHKETLNNRSSLEPTVERELIRGVNFVVTQYKEYMEKYGQYGCPYHFQGDNFYKTHIAFIRERYMDTGVFTVSHIGQTNYWTKYQVWLISRYGKDYNLNPKPHELQEARERYEAKVKVMAENAKAEEEMEKARVEREKARANRGPNRFQVGYAV